MHRLLLCRFFLTTGRSSLVTGCHELSSRLLPVVSSVAATSCTARLWLDRDLHSSVARSETSPRCPAEPSFAHVVSRPRVKHREAISVRLVWRGDAIPQIVPN